MHSHVSVIKEWKLDDDANFVPGLYGCTGCDETSVLALSKGLEDIEHTHTRYVDDCFACKIRTLELSTGDANSGLVDNGWTNKKWNSELDLYKEARAQGIQPDGTSRAQIQQALDISDKTGHAYGSALE